MATVKAKAKRKPSSGGHFPKKGERKVDGVWVAAEVKSVASNGAWGPILGTVTAPGRVRTVGQTAADRRNWFRMKAGWPVLKVKE